MVETVGRKAVAPNPALKPFEFLIGEWRTTGTHPAFSGEELNGRTSFTWHEGGAFLIIRNEVDHPKFPDGVAIIGSSDVAGTFAMIYFDERGTSRIMDVKVEDGTFTWSRDDADFCQRLTISANGPDRLVRKGKIAKPGEDLKDDLSQTFERI